MGLLSVLVDRATPITKSDTATRVNGQKIYESEEGTDFRCRLELPQQQESREAGRIRGVTVPTLYAPARDVEGGPVDIRGEQEIEVRSQELGTSVWMVDGDPAPLRKKRRVLGWQVTLRKVER